MKQSSRNNRGQGSGSLTVSCEFLLVSKRKRGRIAPLDFSDVETRPRKDAYLTKIAQTDVPAKQNSE